MPGDVYHFANTAEAGRMPEEALSVYAGENRRACSGVSTGGVPVAYEIARILSVPLDIWLVRKPAAPGPGELAMGAMTGIETLVLNKEIIKLLNIDEASIDAAIARERFKEGARETE